MKSLRAAMVTPLSGPLAVFGRAAGAAVRLWAEEIVETEIDLGLHDVHPDPVEALRQAEATGPHVLFGPYGRGPTLAVARVTDRLVWNGGGASDLLNWAGFPNVINVPAPAASYMQGGLDAIRASDPGVRSLAVLHTGRGFSREVGRGAMSVASDLGMVCEELLFRPGRACEVLGRLPHADVLAVVGSFRDEQEIVGALRRSRWKAVLAVSAGVDEVLEELGTRREGLIGPAQWTPRSAPPPLLGPGADWFVEAYRRRMGRPPPYPAAQALAAALVWWECVWRTGAIDDGALAAEAERLDTRTLFGAFRLDPVTGLQVGHRVVTVQWQDGRRRVVWPSDLAEARLRLPQ